MLFPDVFSPFRRENVEKLGRYGGAAVRSYGRGARFIVLLLAVVGTIIGVVIISTIRSSAQPATTAKRRWALPMHRVGSPSLAESYYGDWGKDFRNPEAWVDALRFQMFWMGLRPFNLPAMFTLDSLARHMPDVPVYFTILVDTNMTSTEQANALKLIERQLSFFSASGPSIRLQMINNQASFGALLSKTPFESLNLQYAKVAGNYAWKSYNRHHAPHVSDMMRVAIIYKFGGLYFDTDHFFLKDIRELIRVTGPNLYSCEGEEAEPNCRECKAHPSFFSSVAQHNFVRELAERMASYLDREGVSRVFPAPEVNPKDLKGATNWTGFYVESQYKVLWHWCDLASKVKKAVVQIFNKDVDLQWQRYYPKDKKALLWDISIVNRKYISALDWRLNSRTLTQARSNLIHDMETAAYSAELFHTFRDHVVGSLRTDPVARFIHNKTCLHFCNVDDLEAVSSAAKGIRIRLSDGRSA